MALDDAQRATLEELRRRGIENGLTGLALWSRDEVLAHEPNLSPDVQGALWAPTAAIVCPFSATIAFAENAILNGARIVTECAVTGIEVAGGRTTAVETTRGRIATHVRRQRGRGPFGRGRADGRRRELHHHATDAENISCSTIPSATWCARWCSRPRPTLSKGILVAPTVHGNVFIGPNASDVDDPEDHETTRSGFAEIISGAQRIVPKLPLANAITEFAGVRAVAGDDFVIGLSPVVHGLVHAAGIQSPGLTAAPAIAETIVDCLGEAGLKLLPNPAFMPINPVRPKFADLNTSERAKLIAANPLYGRIICRCESITEAEIVAAIHAPCGARTTGRRQAARARRHGPVPGRVLRTAGDRDPRPRTGHTGDRRAQGQHGLVALPAARSSAGRTG